MTDRIMFSTDYPHWDFDAPNQAFPARLSAEQQRLILYQNAAESVRSSGAGTGSGHR